jgi:hypothetical protein
MPTISNYRNVTFAYDKNTILILCETQERQQILLDTLNPAGQQVLWIVLEMLRAETRKNAIQLFSTPDTDNREFDIAIERCLVCKSSSLKKTERHQMHRSKGINFEQVDTPRALLDEV